MFSPPLLILKFILDVRLNIKINRKTKNGINTLRLLSEHSILHYYLYLTCILNTSWTYIKAKNEDSTNKVYNYIFHGKFTKLYCIILLHVKCKYI